MRRFRVTFWICVLFILGPGMAWACAYPTSLRFANTTLLAVLDGGGAVNIHQREALLRAVSQMSPDALKKTLYQEVGRRDARSAAAVIDTSVALSAGRGMVIAPELRDHLIRVRTAVDTACSGQAQVASGAEDAEGAEQGKGRSQGAGGRALSFGEGVTRLSITFTIYLIFLAFLLGIRRTIKERARIAQGNAPPPSRDAEPT